MEYALMASLLLNGALAGFLYGVSVANQAGEPAANDVPGGGIQVPEEYDYDYNQPTIGFKGMNGK